MRRYFAGSLGIGSQYKFLHDTADLLRMRAQSALRWSIELDRLATLLSSSPVCLMPPLRADSFHSILPLTDSRQKLYAGAARYRTETSLSVFTDLSACFHFPQMEALPFAGKDKSYVGMP